MRMRLRLNKRSLWSFWVVMSALLFVVPGDAFAQRRGGGSRSRSTPRAKAQRPKTPKVTKRPKADVRRGDKTGGASKKGFGSGKKKAGKNKKATKADQKAYDKAKANGTAFKDRQSAAASFKKKNAAKYTTTYASKPATRPGHIPQTTMVGGTSTTIIYNQGGGGYGYMNSLGTFMLYNAMADAAMAPYYNRQMASAGYMYGPRPVVGMGSGSIVLLVFGGIIVIAVIGYGIRKAST